MLLLGEPWVVCTDRGPVLLSYADTGKGVPGSSPTSWGLGEGSSSSSLGPVWDPWKASHACVTCLQADLWSFYHSPIGPSPLPFVCRAMTMVSSALRFFKALCTGGWRWQSGFDKKTCNSCPCPYSKICYLANQKSSRYDLSPMTFRARLSLSKSSIVAIYHNLHQGRLNEMHYKNDLFPIFSKGF